MIKIKFQTLIVILVIVFTVNVCSAFKIIINGVDVTKENFSITQLALGTLASHAVHELGHYTTAKYFNSDPSLHFNKVTYDKKMSKSERLSFYRGGYLGQLITGCILTVIPKTRGTDFTTAFTGYSSVHQLTYAVTGGLQNNNLSDTKGITNNGGNGRLEMGLSGVSSAWLTYYNLKYKVSK